VQKRLLAALTGGEPDMVPVWPWMNPFAPDWEEMGESYVRLGDYVRQNADVFYRWSFPTGFAYSAAEVNFRIEEVLSEAGGQRLSVDTPRGLLFQVERTSPARRGRYPVKHWIEDVGDLERFLSIPTEICRPEVEDFLRKRNEMGEKTAMHVELDDPVCVAGYFNTQTWPLLCVEEEAKVTAVVEVMFERIYGLVEYLLEAGVGPVFHFSGPEYSIPPLLPPRYFEKFVVRYDKPLVELIHRHGCLTIIHCHGRVSRFLERFGEIGMDGLNVLEGPPMGDVDMGDAKRRIGGQVCLCGNIEYDRLERGTEEEIKDRVRKIIEQGGEGGRLMVTPTCSPYSPILTPQAERNYVAMIEATREYGRY